MLSALQQLSQHSFSKSCSTKRLKNKLSETSHTSKSCFYPREKKFRLHYKEKSISKVQREIPSFMTYAKTLCGKIQFTNLLSGGNAYNYLSALNAEIGRVCIKYEKEERCTHGSGGET